MKKGVLLTGLILIFNVLIAQQNFDEFKFINSPADELNPVLSHDGQTLYFSRVFSAENTGGIRDPGDIWFSSMTDSAYWSPPQKMAAPINNLQFNGIIGFTDQGNKAFLYEHYMPGGEAARTQGISTMVKRNNEWSDQVRVDIKYFYNKSEQISISISQDASIMLLSLESYGSHGAEDIYVSLKSGNEWTEPKNLGQVINTPYQEMTPYLAADNRTLFFASNGHKGYGGRDIFVSSRLDDSWTNWSPPQNLGPKVNTEGVELSFQYFAGEEKAVYTSTQNSDGYSDLKTIDFPKEELEEIIGDMLKIPEKVIEIVENEIVSKEEIQTASPKLKIVGSVLTENDNSSIEAILSIKKNGWQQSFSASPGEGFEIILPSQDVYQVIIESEGFVSKQEVLDIRTTEANTVRHDFVLQPIAIGTTVKLDNVLFVKGSTELMESSNEQLDLVVKMMKDNPEMEISLAGHTDNQGNARLNQILSQQRVDAVIYYLHFHGVASKRLSGKGYGGSEPITSNDSEETRRLNRRVEFTIEKK